MQTFGLKPVCLNLGECNGLGDLICATPVIKKLYESYGQKVTVLSKMPELFKKNPYVEKSYKIFSVDIDYFNEHYLMHNSFYNMGSKNERGIEYKHNRIDIRQLHAINLGFMLAEGEKDCFYKPTEPCKFPIPDGKYVVIHPVTSWATRTWNESYWIDITQKLSEMGYVVVAIGKDSEETGFFFVEKPVFNLQTANLVNLLNKTSISDCWHLINAATCVITMDSGILHLAGTTDTHIIHLGSHLKPEFRIPYRNGVQGYKHTYVHGTCPLFCGSDMKYGVEEWGNIQGVQPLIRCLENKQTFECHPTVEQVLQKVKELI